MKHVDYRQIDELRALGEGDQLALLILEQFRETIPQRIAAIDSSIAQADFAGIRRGVHALKSSSSYLGAVELGALCDQMESLSPGESLDSLRALRAELAEECRLTVAELESALRA